MAKMRKREFTEKQAGKQYRKPKKQTEQYDRSARHTVRQVLREVVTQ